jgi:hypothetical protein
MHLFYMLSAIGMLVRRAAGVRLCGWLVLRLSSALPMTVGNAAVRRAVALVFILMDWLLTGLPGMCTLCGLAVPA